jgi:hypothetical protein
MDRKEATKLARSLLDQYDLQTWKLHLSNDNRFMGMCSHKDKVIFLNQHHIDTHPESEIKDTILHEIAHCLVGPNHGHDEEWQNKAKELGALPNARCSIGLDATAIDAIRSGHQVEAVVEEEVVKKVSYRVTRLQDKCEFCSKVAKEKFAFETEVPIYEVFADGSKRKTNETETKKFITLKCGHIVVKSVPKGTPFESIVFDGDENCKHSWTMPPNVEYKTICSKCSAKRPYLFQVKGMQFLEASNGRAAVFDEQGLGKTLQALGYIKFHTESHPFLYICKSGLKFQAMKEIVRILGMQFIPYVFQSSKDFIFPGFKCYIVSYDLLRRMDAKKLEELGKIVKCIVIDEVQHIKNPDSSRTQEVRKLCKNVNQIIPLSGTHWKNRGSESYVALNLVNPMKFNSFEAFKRNWVTYYWEGSKMKEGGLKKGFREYCSDIFIRRERQEVLKELPLINRTYLHCQMPKEAMEAYDDKVDDFVKIWNQLVIGGEEGGFVAAQNVLAQLNAMRQLIGIAKIPATLEFAQEFLENTDRKLVCFVHHIAVGQKIYDEMKIFCDENQIPIFRLGSDMDPMARGQMCEDFNKAEKAFLVASTLASGEGLNLQTCSDCIMHERQWNPANEEQAEGRFIRIGQKSESVNATYVHAEETVDVDFGSIVERKRIFFHTAMNKGEMPQWNANSLIKELGNALAERWRQKHRATNVKKEKAS